MDSTTRRLVSALLEEEECVIIRKMPGPKMSRQYGSLGILDSVYNEFIETNSHNYRDLKAICLAEITHDTFMKYSHEGIPYLATLFRRVGTTRKMEVHVKLCNNGFVYFPKPGNYISRHWSNTGISYDECFRFMPSLAANIRDAGYMVYCAFYSYEDQRLDIKAFNDDDPALPNLVLTYEPGYPYEEDDVKRTPL